MKRIMDLAIEAVEERDLIDDQNRRLYGEGFVLGYCEALRDAAELAGRNLYGSETTPSLEDAIRELADQEYADGGT